jgi:hypothetical protein
VVVTAEAATAVAAGVVDAELAPAASLTDRASQIGAEWATEYVRGLRAQARAPVGAWPGTMSEARSRVVSRLAVVLEPEQLAELARVANLAARRGWREVCEPDLEL